MVEIVISEFMDQASVDKTSKKYELFYDPELVDRPDDLKKLLSEARALVVRNRTQVNKALLDAAPHLKVVGRLGVGLDNIDLVECEKRQITVCPATGANDVAVAEWVICSAMMLFRGAFLSRSQMSAGEWPRQQCMGNEIGDKTLGLIGFGGIAQETAIRARALGMRVIAFDPYLPADNPKWQEAIRCETLANLLQQADVISLHVPLTETTQHLINADAISQMKKGAVVINAARVGVVDEKALVDALKTGKISGAALDVFEVEPLTETAASQFAGIPNLILTPHIGGVTVESNVRVSGVTMDNVCKVLEAVK
jgi:(S)-sulfolactate dehydrogenase